MNCKIPYFLLIFLCMCIDSNSVRLPEIYSYYDEDKLDETSCEIALQKFAETSSGFTFCSINYSRPIHFCELCIDPYMNVLSAHQTILTAEVNGTKCKDKLINVDRLEVIESIFSNMQDMWKKAYCDKCFDWSDGKPTLSNQTKYFINYFNIAKKCINDHIKEANINNNTDKICKDCMSDYVMLNSFYESLKGTSETVGICMDIVDSMNATRSIWSDVLNCCRLRRTPELIFLICTGVITTLPAMFYMFAKIFCGNSSRPTIVERRRYAESRNCPPSTSIN